MSRMRKEKGPPNHDEGRAGRDEHGTAGNTERAPAGVPCVSDVPATLGRLPPAATRQNRHYLFCYLRMYIPSNQSNRQSCLTKSDTRADDRRKMGAVLQRDERVVHPAHAKAIQAGKKKKKSQERGKETTRWSVTLLRLLERFPLEGRANVVHNPHLFLVCAYPSICQPRQDRSPLTQSPCRGHLYAQPFGTERTRCGGSPTAKRGICMHGMHRAAARRAPMVK